MAGSTAFLREFVRGVFRDAKSKGISLETVLDDLAIIALDASNSAAGKGKVATGITTQEGNSYTWRLLGRAGGYERQIELIDAARGVIGNETDTSDETRNSIVSSIVTVRSHSTDFS